MTTQSLYQRAISKRSLATPPALGQPLLGSPSPSEEGLKSSLGFGSLLAFGVAGTCGAGIFVTTGVASRGLAGAAIPLAVVLAGTACLFDGLCYADVSSKIPASGSVYSYAFHHFGELPAFLMAGVLLLEYGISGCATARGCANYIIALLHALGVPLPALFSTVILPAPLDRYFTISLLPLLLILICSFICSLGVEESASFTNLISAVNVSLIIFICFLGSLFFEIDHFKPLIPPAGSGAIVEAAAVMMFCFLGFDAVTTLAEESQNPSRDIPMGLLGTLGVVGILYCGVSTVLVGMVPPSHIDIDAPLSMAFLQHGARWQSVLVCLGASLTSFCATLTCVVGQSRVFYRMAKDGVWFRVYQQLDHRRVPSRGMWVSATFLSFAAGTLNFEFLVRLISAGSIVSFSLVNVIVLKNYLPPLPQEESIGIRTLTQGRLYLASLVLSVAVIIMGLVMKMGSIVLASLSGVVILGCIAFLFQCRPSQAFDLRGFSCPLVPIIPLTGLVVNSFLIASLQIGTILQTALFLSLCGAIWLIRAATTKDVAVTDE